MIKWRLKDVLDVGIRSVFVNPGVSLDSAVVRSMLRRGVRDRFLWRGRRISEIENVAAGWRSVLPMTGRLHGVPLRVNVRESLRYPITIRSLRFRQIGRVMRNLITLWWVFCKLGISKDVRHYGEWITGVVIVGDVSGLLYEVAVDDTIMCWVLQERCTSRLWIYFSDISSEKWE